MALVCENDELGDHYLVKTQAWEMALEPPKQEAELMKGQKP